VRFPLGFFEADEGEVIAEEKGAFDEVAVFLKAGKIL